jgi:hypothetical protein
MSRTEQLFVNLCRVILLASLLCPSGAAAQINAPKLDVTQESDLYFGRLLAGISTTVDPLAGGAAFFELRGPKLAELLIEFLLPTDLVGESSGALLPVTFGPNAAAFSPTQRTTSAVFFDPSVPHSVITIEEEKSLVWVGGTVMPPFGLPADRYSAPIVITVSVVGS